MPYDALPERQRAAFLAALGNTATNQGKSNPELMFEWLGLQGAVGTDLNQRLQSWGQANGIPQGRWLADAGVVVVGTPPGAPTIGTATAGDAQATVTFTAPGSSGSSPITGYRVTSSPGGITATGASSPITVTGLTNGVAYTFTVQATNSTGYGAASAASNSVTPVSDPVTPLFASGEQGAWYDPSDLSTLFQDSAGTTPVTAVGQSVGRINDKSGRGNHAVQGTAAKRPVLRQDGGGRRYLDFDGVDDALVTVAAVNLTATNKAFMFVGIYRDADASEVYCELGAGASGLAGAFTAAVQVDGYSAYLRGNAFQNGTTVAGFPFATPHVVASIFDIGGATPETETMIRVNGALAGTGTGSDAGGGNFANAVINIGARNANSVFFNGRIYGLIIRGAACTAQQITDVETWLNEKTGAF